MEKRSSVMKITWAKSAINGIKKIYDYIEEDSPQNAAIIIDEVAEKITELKDNPQRYGIDKNKKNNSGNYRYFEHKKIRISYKVYSREIEIVRVRHTKQKPSTY